MSKYDFMRQVEECLKTRPEFENAGIEGNSYVHNNDTERIGVVIRFGEEDLSPIIYLDRFYEDYQKKKLTIGEISDSVVQLCKNLKNRPIDVSRQLDWEYCRDRITFRLISSEWNEQYLSHLPHVDFLNLAIIFTVIYRITEEGVESVRITDEILERWGVGVKELMSLAIRNTPEIFPPRCQSIVDVLEEFMDCRIEQDPLDVPMLLLSNEQSVYGATTILYEDSVVRIGEELQEDFYIIPSSIHEVLILPEHCVSEADELNSMITQINRDHVIPEDVLSDRVYFYKRNEKRFYF